MTFEEFLHSPNSDKPLFRDPKPRKVKTKRNDIEYQECKILAKWLDSNSFFYSHLANETYTDNQGVLAKRRAMGVKKGVPDYVIFINNNNENTIIWIEMKTKKGVQSPEQKDWEREINKVKGSQYFLCRSADEAIETVKEIYKKLKNKND